MDNGVDGAEAAKELKLKKPSKPKTEGQIQAQKRRAGLIASKRPRASLFEPVVRWYLPKTY